MWQSRAINWDDPDGLVAVGGDLRPETLLGAYRRGIFPWFNEGDPILWWSPDPRAVFELDQFHASRRLLRTCRGGKFTLTVNQAFPAVMRACGEREEGTWITHAMLAGYAELHRLGHAHSVEAWREGELVGGVYGVAQGGLFAAESMFHRAADAGKVALVHLVERLRERGFTLFDTQMLTPVTASLGAVEIPRAEYLRRLRAALRVPAAFV